MGTGASKTNEIGVGINPRVRYADYRSTNVKKDVLIDAPVLVKLDHGTIRYRYTEDEESRKEKDSKREVNHEGDGRAKKDGYFFHTTLDRFGTGAIKEKEEDYKFCYVYKGAAKAKQKKVYYVFGKGLKTNEHGFIEPRNYDAKEAYKGPTAYKLHGHVYFDLIFLKQDAEIDGTVSDEGKVDKAGKQPVTVVVDDKDTLETVMINMARRMIKPVTHLHVFQFNNELKRDTVVSSLRTPPDGTWRRFRILLKPK